MSSFLLTEITCETAVEFLNMILPSGEYFSSIIKNSTWLFRGQGVDYDLIPSIFRKDENSIKKFKSLTNRDVAGSYEQLLLAEKDFLDSFFSIADKRGFQIPDDSQSLRSKLSDYRRHNQHVLNERGEWLFSGGLLSLVAMAQHYGIPTRLLDWTLQPLIAAFFAADGGAKRFNPEKKEFSDPETPIVVWAFFFPLFDVNIHFLTKDFTIKGVTAPGSSNPNLKAQQGVFTLVHHWFTNETNNDYLPLHKIVENLSVGRYSRDVEGCELLKITLPVYESFKLLNLLAKLDIAPSSIYPRYDSIIEDIRMQKSWMDCDSK